MKNITHFWRASLCAGLIAAICLLTIQTSAQDLVPVSSLTGGSIFVFRNAARTARKFVVSFKPTRTKAQRLETAKKIRKQYEAIAKTAPRTGRAKPLDPAKLPKTYAAGEGSRLVAGVGEYYTERGEYDQAIEFFTQAIRLDPNNTAAKLGFSEALALKGNDLLVKDQAGAAKAIFLEALEYNPKNSAAHFGLGEVYAELNQTNEAIANYEKSLENNKELTEIYVPLGILYYQADNITKADELLTKALAFSADSAETQFFLGLVRFKQNRNEEAADGFQKAKTMDPTLAEAFYYSGETLVRLKRTRDAVADFKKATELKPNNFDAWLALGEAYFEIGDYENAIVAYKAAAKLKNNNWEAVAGLGESYRMSKKYNDALSNYELAILFLRSNKDFNKETAAEIYSKIAFVIGAQCQINRRTLLPCKWPAAIKASEDAIALLDDPVDYAILGWANYNAALIDFETAQPTQAPPKLEKAKVALQKALTGPPEIQDDVLQNLGSVQIHLRDYSGAIASLKPVVERRPDLKYTLGSAYYYANDFDNAAKMFRSVLDKDPNDVRALSNLGMSEVGRKNGKEVKKIIDRLRVLSAIEAIKVEAAAKKAKVI